MKIRSPGAVPDSLSSVSGRYGNNSTLQKALRRVPFMQGRAPVAPISPASGLSYLTTNHGDVLLVDNPAAIDLKPEPVPHDWILSGTPEASIAMLLRSRDWLQTMVVWECTAGRFNWRYNKDEVLFVISGHATLTNESGENREFGPGDTVFFPAGVSCTWWVRDRVRKVAIIRETLFWPLGVFVKVWVKLLRMVGIAAKSPF
jgi:uncharacterized cupin superfamily protein